MLHHEVGNFLVIQFQSYRLPLIFFVDMCQKKNKQTNKKNKKQKKTSRKNQLSQYKKAR